MGLCVVGRTAKQPSRKPTPQMVKNQPPVPRKVQGDVPFLVRGRHLLAMRETALYPRGAAAWSSAGGIAVWPLGPRSGRLEAGS